MQKMSYDSGMSDILEQIYKELDAIGATATALCADAQGAARQTDLEVAILKQQVSDLREKNARAKGYIAEAKGILEQLKMTNNT